MKIIDAHQHFWKLGGFAYAWLSPGLSAIYRDFLPADLFPLMSLSGVEQSVLVQADSSLEETAWMLALCEQHPQIAGVVGWVDLASPDLAADLERLAENPRLRGVRPALPPLESDWGFLDEALSLLARHHLSCDLLLHPEVYHRVLDLARRHSNLIFVLDHLAGARLTDHGHREWGAVLHPLACLPNVVMKLSGYLTAAATSPLAQQVLQPYITIALEQFGADRLMFGSDWPVCTLGGSYELAVELLSLTTGSLTENENADLWGGTAQRVYRLADSN